MLGIHTNVCWVNIPSVKALFQASYIRRMIQYIKYQDNKIDLINIHGVKLNDMILFIIFSDYILQLYALI